jgi:predicted NAD/FAD-binding protein
MAMKIAIIGTGIAGNVAAWHLNREHDITVFEADNRIGGHTNTLNITLEGRQYAVDTGFIVFNDWTYPNFIALLDELGVASQESDMSFSLRNDRANLEYKGSTLNSLFAQRRNLVRPSFYRMLRDVLRFEREAPTVLEPDAEACSLGGFLHSRKYSDAFIDHYIIPMGAAIWSSRPTGMLEMPAKFFVRFFKNHGLLSVNNRPTWRVVKGGSSQYVEKLVEGHRQRIHLNAPVRGIRRHAGGVEVSVENSEPLTFDKLFVACHSDQALDMLEDASIAERETLGAIRYQENEAVLHTDTSMMPRRKLAWAAWNYHVSASKGDRVALTYNMNILQGLDAPEQFCVTLNKREGIEAEKILDTVMYSHPVFDEPAVSAQARQREINGANHTYFCGAYWRYGFHEDGVVSALDALQHFKDDLKP